MANGWMDSAASGAAPDDALSCAPDGFANFNSCSLVEVKIVEEVSRDKDALTMSRLPSRLADGFTRSGAGLV